MNNNLRLVRNSLSNYSRMNTRTSRTVFYFHGKLIFSNFSKPRRLNPFLIKQNSPRRRRRRCIFPGILYNKKNPSTDDLIQWWWRVIFGDVNLNFPFGYIAVPLFILLFLAPPPIAHPLFAIICPLDIGSIQPVRRINTWRLFPILCCRFFGRDEFLIYLLQRDLFIFARRFVRAQPARMN